MARPIRGTPVLTGKDAERFLRIISNSKPISKEEREKIESFRCGDPDLDDFLLNDSLSYSACYQSRVKP